MNQEQQETRERIASVIHVSEFGEPACDEDIERVEQQLEVSFPSWLRSIYRACNGFTTRFGMETLFSLAGIVRYKKFLQIGDEEDLLPDWFPRAIIFVCEGACGVGTMHWAALDGELIKWCFEDWDEFNSPKQNFFDLLKELQNTWDEWDRER